MVNGRVLCVVLCCGLACAPSPFAASAYVSYGGASGASASQTGWLWP
jgi:hypothetical protein